jgi:hypothetical protein
MHNSGSLLATLAWRVTLYVARYVTLCGMYEDIMTTAQVAAESGVKKRVIQYQLLRGLLKGRRQPISGVWLIKRSDYAYWLETRNG